MTRVGAIMRRDLVVATGTESVATAIGRMATRDVGVLVVLCGGRVCGILSERDVVRRLIAVGRDPGETRVSEVATTSPTAVGEETTLEECAALLSDSGFRHLPIVDSEGRPLGILSSRDLLDFVVERLRR